MRHGKHIKLIGKGNPKILGDRHRVEFLLRNLVEKIAMRALGGPVMHDVELDIRKLGQEPFEDEGGVTGVIVLSTSHIAIHTWPLKPLFILDVFSCRDFSSGVILAEVRDNLESESVAYRDLSDSLDFPE